MRLMIASASGRRNRRGLGCPAADAGDGADFDETEAQLGETVDGRAVLVQAAASPTGLAKFRPMTVTGNAAGACTASR
jgi:hypothetical protein